MYSAYNSSLEKNQMMTPPTIGLTSSIVNDKLGNITLEDNSNDLFSMNEDNTAIQTKDGVPLEASQFKITSTNTEINSDDTNAVNKSYCDSNYIKNTNPLTLNQISVSSITLRNTYGDAPIQTTYFSYKDDDGVTQGVSTIKLNGSNMFMSDRAYFANPISIYGTNGIIFNSNFRGQVSLSSYPQGQLRNLVPSTITSAQLTTLSSKSYLDNVCPTYQFCQNTYLRKSDAEDTYLKQDDAETTYVKTGALGSLIQTASIAWPSGFDTYLTGVKSIITGTCDYITGGRVNTLGEIGTCVKEFSIPSNITGNTKIVDTVFYLSSTKTAQAEHLVAALNTSSTNCMFGALSKGVYMGKMVFDENGAVDEYWYKFHLSCVFTGSFNKLYIHFYFDDTSISGTASGLTMKMRNSPALNDQTSITIIAI